MHVAECSILFLVFLPKEQSKHTCDEVCLLTCLLIILPPHPDENEVGKALCAEVHLLCLVLPLNPSPSLQKKKKKALSSFFFYCFWHLL